MEGYNHYDIDISADLYEIVPAKQSDYLQDGCETDVRGCERISEIYEIEERSLDRAIEQAKDQLRIDYEDDTHKIEQDSLEAEECI